MDILTISLNNVRFSEVSLRAHQETDAHIIELANDIEVRGLLNLPSLVPSTEEGIYYVTDGARRVTALKRLLKEGKVEEMQLFQVKSIQDELDTLSDMVAGNANIRKTANRQYISALYRLATETELSLPELAKKVGMTEEYIMKLFKTLKLSQEILEKAEKGEVSISNLITLSDLAGKVPEDELELWIDKAKEETAKDFSVSVAEELDTIKQSLKGERKEPIFEHKPKLKSKEELNMLLIQCQTAFEKEGNEANEARFQLMKEIWQIDEASVAAAKKDWELKQSDKETKKKERKLARDKAKLEDYKQTLEEEGYSVNKDK